MEIPPEYVQNVTAFSFPYIHTKYEYRDLKVVLRGRPGEDSWAITDEPYCYQPRGRRWAYERLPSSRTDRFLKASRMPLAQALPLAERLARSKKRRWDQRLARMIARQEAREAAERQQQEE